MGGGEKNQKSRKNIHPWQDHISETPPIDFNSEDDSDIDYDDDAIEVLCFRVVVSREATLVTDSE